jgi:hypothetical protein
MFGCTHVYEELFCSKKYPPDWLKVRDEGLSSVMEVVWTQELKPSTLSIMHMKDVKSAGKLFEWQ